MTKTEINNVVKESLHELHNKGFEEGYKEGYVRALNDTIEVLKKSIRDFKPKEDVTNE